MKNPYGLRDGELLSVDLVERGLACQCVCPGCGHRLEAHKGGLRSPYFSHYRGADCGAGYETALHVLAKEVLSKTKRLLLPPLKVRADRGLLRPGTVRTDLIVVPRWQRFTFESVALEKVLETIVPDVLLELRGRRLLVEIKVTHAVDREKFDKIKALDISTIEYDFSAADRALTKQDLKAALIEKYMPPGQGNGFWVHHAKLDEAQDRVNQEYLAANPDPPPPPPPKPPKAKKPPQRVLF